MAFGVRKSKSAGFEDDFASSPRWSHLSLEDREEGEGSSSSSSSGSAEEPEIFIHTRSTTSNLGVQEKDLTYISLKVEETFGLRIHEFLLRLATVVWFFTGMYCVMYCGIEEERQDAISAMYLMVQLITTVGYGDIFPKSSGMQVFMACYVFIGNVLTALVISERLQTMINRSHGILKSNMVTNMVEGAREAHGKVCEESCAKRPPSKWGGVITAFSTYVGFLLVGALFYAFLDNCVCPAGHLDCAIDVSCEEASGKQRSFTESFYMASITLTTVGFGDEAPTSKWGRLFGVFWMLFGVTSMANFLAELAHLVLLHNMHDVAEHGMSHDLFMKIDQDSSGTLTKFEFTTYMLVKYGLVSEPDLDMLLVEFDKFDKDHSGELTYEEISGGSGGQPCLLAADRPKRASSRRSNMGPRS